MRQNLAVVDELLTHWNLADSEQVSVLDELEEGVFFCDVHSLRLHPQKSHITPCTFSTLINKDIHFLCLVIIYLIETTHILRFNTLK